MLDRNVLRGDTASVDFSLGLSSLEGFPCSPCRTPGFARQSLGFFSQESRDRLKGPLHSIFQITLWLSVILVCPSHPFAEWHVCKVSHDILEA